MICTIGQEEDWGSKYFSNFRYTQNISVLLFSAFPKIEESNSKGLSVLVGTVSESGFGCKIPITFLRTSAITSGCGRDPEQLSLRMRTPLLISLGSWILCFLRGGANRETSSSLSSSLHSWTLEEIFTNGSNLDSHWKNAPTCQIYL